MTNRVSIFSLGTDAQRQVLNVLQAEQSRAGMKTEKRSNKYGAKPVVIDGIRFDSTAEGNRYDELKLMQKAGVISGLEVHPVFPLRGESGSQVGSYEADFAYIANGARVVEDVKSKPTRTALYRRNKRHLEADYGVKITEIMP